MSGSPFYCPVSDITFSDPPLENYMVYLKGLILIKKINSMAAFNLLRLNCKSATENGLFLPLTQKTN